MLLAQKICDQLRAQNKDAIREVYFEHHIYLIKFAGRQLYDPECADDVLTEFWIKLLDGKIICNFKGKARLRSYLTSVLLYRIMDENKKTQKELAHGISLEEYVEKNRELPARQSRSNRELCKIMDEAMLTLFDISPKDASLIRMKMQGMTYGEMAGRALKRKTIQPNEVKRETDRIKKQFTRKQTGSMAKFKIVLDRLLKEKALDLGNLLNE